MALPIAAASVAAGRAGVQYAAANAPALLEKARTMFVKPNGQPAASNVAELTRIASSGQGPAIAVLEQLSRAGIRPDLLLSNVSPEYMGLPEMQALRQSLINVHGNIASQANAKGGNVGIDAGVAQTLRAINDEISNAMSKLGLRSSRDLWAVIKVLRVLNEKDLENYYTLTGR